VSKDSVSITISDASGAVVRTLRAPGTPGSTGVVEPARRSDEAGEDPDQPEYAPWFSVSLEGRDAPTVGRMGVLQPPGTYTVKIVGTNESQPLVLRKDPNTSDATDAALTENVAAVRRIAVDLDSAVTMINALENVRGQLAALKATVSSDSTRKDVVTAADSLDEKLRVVERKLFQTRATGRGQDILRWPQRVSEQLQYLAGRSRRATSPQPKVRSRWRSCSARRFVL
jgi:DNA-binding FrmR family transcriptional regulator